MKLFVKFNKKFNEKFIKLLLFFINKIKILIISSKLKSLKFSFSEIISIIKFNKLKIFS